MSLEVSTSEKCCGFAFEKVRRMVSIDRVLFHICLSSHKRAMGVLKRIHKYDHCCGFVFHKVRHIIYRNPIFKESFIVDTHKPQLGRIINYTPLQNILSNMTTTLTGVRLC